MQYFSVFGWRSCFRWLVLPAVALLLTACGSSAYQHHSIKNSHHSPMRQAIESAQCAFAPEQCMYDGPYEPGERAYAEEEAKRLNRNSLNRLRRSY